MKDRDARCCQVKNFPIYMMQGNNFEFDQLENLEWQDETFLIYKF